MNSDELLSRLIDCQMMIASALVDFHADPALVANAHWRANLAQTGYQIETLLSDED